MSQYNHFAKDLDTAFKEAREANTPPRMTQ